MRLLRWSLVGFMGVFGCSSPDVASRLGVAEAQAKPAPPAPSPATTSQAAQLLAAYIAAHDKLVADDLAGARTAFTKLRDAATAASSVADVGLRKRIWGMAGKGVNAKDLAAARETLRDLTVAMVEWLKSEPNPTADTVRLASCPMAFGSGAKWLQVGDKVKNPYYGSEMPSCGTLDRAAKPGEKLSAK